MIVEQIMNTTLHTLSPKNTIREASRLMRGQKIRHIPIVDDQGQVIGIITERDIKNLLPSQEVPQSSLFEAPIASIMTKNPIVGHPLDFVDEIALTFYEAKISCMPIISAGKLVGIVTTTDLLYSYIELTGAHKPGSKIDIRVSDKPGMLFEISKIFHEHQVNVLSVLVYPDGESVHTRILSVRLQVINPLTIIQDLRMQGYTVLWPNLPGVTP